MLTLLCVCSIVLVMTMTWAVFDLRESGVNMAIYVASIAVFVMLGFVTQFETSAQDSFLLMTKTWTVVEIQGDESATVQMVVSNNDATANKSTTFEVLEGKARWNAPVRGMWNVTEIHKADRRREPVQKDVVRLLVHSVVPNPS